VERIAARYGVDAREAERRLKESDATRARYHRHHYQRDWNDATNYHMVLNTGALGVEGAVEQVVARAREMWGESVRRER
jgi:cytidylate kinase